MDRPSGRRERPEFTGAQSILEVLCLDQGSEPPALANLHQSFETQRHRWRDEEITAEIEASLQETQACNDQLMNPTKLHQLRGNGEILYGLTAYYIFKRHFTDSINSGNIRNNLGTIYTLADPGAFGLPITGIEKECAIIKKIYRELEDILRAFVPPSVIASNHQIGISYMSEGKVQTILEMLQWLQSKIRGEAIAPSSHHQLFEATLEVIEGEDKTTLKPTVAHVEDLTSIPDEYFGILETVKKHESTDVRVFFMDVLRTLFALEDIPEEIHDEIKANPGKRYDILVKHNLRISLLPDKALVVNNGSDEIAEFMKFLQKLALILKPFSRKYQQTENFMDAIAEIKETIAELNKIAPDFEKRVADYVLTLHSFTVRYRAVDETHQTPFSYIDVCVDDVSGEIALDFLLYDETIRKSAFVICSDIEKEIEPGKTHILVIPHSQNSVPQLQESVASLLSGITRDVSIVSSHQDIQDGIDDTREGLGLD